MRLHNGIVLSVAAFIVAFLATSCAYRDGISAATYTPEPTVIEPGLAYGIPCKPPCWHGLIPGKSTYGDAAQVIEQLRASGQVDSIDEGPTWFIVYPVQGMRGAVYGHFENNVLQRINGRVEFYYPVGSLVEQFGAPEGVYLIGKGSTICSSCEEWEPPEPPGVPVEGSGAILFYPGQGLRFSMLIPTCGLGCICPEMPVVAFWYYSPRSMQEALDDYNRYLTEAYPGAGLTVASEDLIEWHGFGGGY